MLQLRYNSEPFGNNHPIYLDHKETHTRPDPSLICIQGGFTSYEQHTN